MMIICEKGIQKVVRAPVHCYNDGGRAEAGYKGDTGDCVVRAIAIAAELDYKTVYDELASRMAAVKPRKVYRNADTQKVLDRRPDWQRRIKRRDARKRSPRNGVTRKIYEPYLFELGFTWTPTMKIGQGCKVHLSPDELPSGRLVVTVSKHVTAVIEGVLNDTYDCCRGGSRCVYGYYRRSI